VTPMILIDLHALTRPHPPPPPTAAMAAVPSIPNVYFSYPSTSGGPIEQAVDTQRPQTSSRPKSRARAPSAKRPTSAKKGSRKDEAKTKSQFLSFDEAQQVHPRAGGEGGGWCTGCAGGWGGCLESWAGLVRRQEAGPGGAALARVPAKEPSKRAPGVVLLPSLTRRIAAGGLSRGQGLQ
jgi:hypothetical protein